MKETRRGVTVDAYPIEVCIDCYYDIEAGVQTPSSEALAEMWDFGQGYRLAMGQEDCADCTEDAVCEKWFSHSDCDGCGSHLPGDRHHATVYREPSDLELLARVLDAV